MVGRIRRRYHNLQRYRQIVTVLIKYGFGQLVEELNLKQYLPFFIPKERVRKIAKSQRIRMALEELGPTFIKLGQILSSRPDLISPELMEELIKLQDCVAPFSFQEVKEIIKEELNQSLEKIFIEIDEEAIASASIAQVHKAKLKNGERVIVKIQRPQIKETIESDIDILRNLASMVEKRFPEMANYNLKSIVDEFAISIRRELNFRIEAFNIERFKRNMSGFNKFYLPKLYKEYTTDKILVLEEVEGIKINDIEAIEKKNLNRRLIAKNGADIILKQIFIDGFFHADPHPGNIFVVEGNKLCFLDFGIVGRLDSESKRVLCELFIAIYQKDASKMVNIFEELGLIKEKVNINKLKGDIGDLIEHYYSLPLKEINFQEIAGEIFKLIQEYRLTFPSNMIMLIRCLITLEGIGKTLYPEFNLAQEAEPFLEKLIEERSIYIEHLKKVGHSLNKLRVIPDRLEELLKKTNRDELKLSFIHKGLENLISEMDRVSNRISFSVIIAALIIGSSLILQMKEGPLILGIPLLGILGFVIAAILGLGLVISILRSGKL